MRCNAPRTAYGLMHGASDGYLSATDLRQKSRYRIALASIAVGSVSILAYIAGWPEISAAMAGTAGVVVSILTW